MNKDEAKKILDSIKVLFGMEKKEEQIESNFAEVTLKDGNKVMVDKLEVGGKVEDGKAGELVLEDGSILVLDENGIITEVKAPEAPEAIEAAEVVTDVPESVPEVNPLEERIAQLEAQMAEILNLLNSMAGEFKSTKSEFEKQIKIIGETTIVEPVNFSKQIKFEEMTPFQQFMETRKLNNK